MTLVWSPWGWVPAPGRELTEDEIERVASRAAEIMQADLAAKLREFSRHLVADLGKNWRQA